MELHELKDEATIRAALREEFAEAFLQGSEDVTVNAYVGQVYAT